MAKTASEVLVPGAAALCPSNSFNGSGKAILEIILLALRLHEREGSR